MFNGDPVFYLPTAILAVATTIVLINVPRSARWISNVFGKKTG